MFTGIVEAMGRVAETVPEGPGRRLRIEVPAPLDDGSCRLGDSVCLNGCCLTVVGIDGPRWTFQAGAETLSRTNLGRLTVGSPLNLERSMSANGRLGGHIVQGHVDGIGRVDQVTRDGEWTTFGVSAPTELTAMMVPKGSIAVDGVSLTLVTVEATRFTVALIPHTLAATTLGIRQPGDEVNLEVDVLGKYVRKFLESWAPGMIGSVAIPF